MNFLVMVIDDSLGDLRFVRQLLEGLQGVQGVQVLAAPDETAATPFVPDFLILGPRWLGWARRLREQYPECFIVGRCPWQGEVAEFFPWGNQLREPSIPLPNLLPLAS